MGQLRCTGHGFAKRNAVDDYFSTQPVLDQANDLTEIRLHIVRIVQRGGTPCPVPFRYVDDSWRSVNCRVRRPPSYIGQTPRVRLERGIGFHFWWHIQREEGPRTRTHWILNARSLPLFRVGPGQTLMGEQQRKEWKRPGFDPLPNQLPWSISGEH
jgi:hypothetical protein